MLEGWKTYKLGDLASLGDGAHSKVKRLDEGVLYLTSKNFKEGRLHLDKIDYISKEDYNKLFCNESKAINKPSLGDLLMGIIGTLGNVYLYKENDKFGISSSVAIIRPNNDKVNSSYLYYYITGREFKHYQNAHNGASVQGYTNLPSLRSIPIKIPVSLQEQHSIASILSALDDKIELNLQMNKTLEEMAMALYKHWFVDFGPFQSGEFVDSELGEIPKDWEVKKLEELLLVKPMNGLYKKKEFQGFGSRWLKMKSVYGLDIITNQEMELISVTYKEIEKYGCLYDDLVFGRTSLVLEGIGKCAIIKSIDDTPIFESNLFRIRPDKNKIDSNILFLFFKSEKGREEVRKLARQTAAVSITSKDLIGIKIPVPNSEIQKKTAKTLDNYILNIINNLKENQSLTTLRDTLLPKLISGEVRVKDKEQTIAQVL
jgi:type I restriction enzyme S subunit